MNIFVYKDRKKTNKAEKGDTRMEHKWKLILVLLLLFLTACSGKGGEEKVSSSYTWEAPNKTSFIFKTKDFSGYFFPERIAYALKDKCVNPLPVKEVEIVITDAIGYNGGVEVHEEAGYAVTAKDYEGDKITRIWVRIAGGGFARLKDEKSYFYPAETGNVETIALDDLNASIMEEIGYHVCQLSDDEGPAHQLHAEFLQHPIRMFEPAPAWPTEIRK